MATPLKRVRGLGAARHGTETFWRQRLTAVANVPLVIFLIWFVVSHAGASYEVVKASLANPVVSVLMLAMIWSAAIHMRIGLREIIEDYLHNKLCKVSSLMLATFFSAGLAIASTLAVLKISLGG
ncbi:MAG: succinate dehydrogenase, hydrophobic membrane anchor protein [Methyloceanibacter sp.]|nr:succinate dehydrogenase, hydrophobic membrane anchor protein [Methyloceanibacter sp.]